MNRITVSSDIEFDHAASHVCRLSASTDVDRAIAEKIEATRAIVSAVRERGDGAVADYTKRFDGVDLAPQQFEVAPDKIKAAANTVARTSVTGSSSLLTEKGSERK